MDELEELKKKRLEELQSGHEQIKSQMQEEAELQQQVEALEELVRSRLTKEALQRYGNLKTVYPEKAVQLLMVLAQAIQTGQLKLIDDEQLKNILERISEKRDFKITRK